MVSSVVCGHGTFSWLICSSNLVAVPLPFSHLAGHPAFPWCWAEAKCSMKEISSKAQMIARCLMPVEEPVWEECLIFPCPCDLSVLSYWQCYHLRLMKSIFLIPAFVTEVTWPKCFTSAPISCLPQFQVELRFILNRHRSTSRLINPGTPSQSWQQQDSRAGLSEVSL